jgi:hypothetical protein
MVLAGVSEEYVRAIEGNRAAALQDGIQRMTDVKARRAEKEKQQKAKEENYLASIKTTVPCPACSKLIYPGVKKCRHCGKALPTA